MFGAPKYGANFVLNEDVIIQLYYCLLQQTFQSKDNSEVF